MSALTITTSANIAILDSLIIADLCAGKFYVDVTPSTYIGDGAINVLGASVEIVNPYGVTVKTYSTSGYDIFSDSPPMTGRIEFSIPTQAGNYQYGTYQVSVKLTDSDDRDYIVKKSVKICAPDASHKTRNYGSLSATISGICRDGKAFIVVDTPPNYNGKEVESEVNDFELLYPTESQLDPIETTLNSFSVHLYEGEYRVSGTVCATYNYGDNVYVSVNYKVKKSKEVKCIIDECCVFGKLAELHKGLSEKCTAAEITVLSNTALDALRLLKTAQLAAECGEDASDYITDLESLLGCKCTCNCNEGTPLINNSPAKDFTITGCNVTKEIVGLTDHYTIENYAYAVEVNPNGGVLTVSAPTLANCTKTYTLSFNAAKAYGQIKALADTDYNSWAAIINRSITSLDPTCVGYNSTQWGSMSFAQRFGAVMNAACNGGVCEALIEDDETAVSGSSVGITWNEISGVYAVDIYMDDVLKGSVLAGVEGFSIAGAADGNAHTYSLISKCANGVIGNALDGQFTYIGCPTIAVPTVTSSTVTGADCPYDITALVNALPSGIEAEWHTANNTNTSTLVPDEENVSSGTYYVFAKNADNCYSLGVKVTITCTADTGCSAPQSLIVETITDGNRIRFISAAFPPPSNSYTVKRRLSVNADVDGSYTTIGTPTYNSGASRWEILDETAADNTLYVYKAISNCTSSAPSISTSYANISCPTLTLTPSDDSMGYSFVPVGGDVDEYVVEIYNASGTTRISYDTHDPSFSNPTTGTFIYLDESTSYKVRMKVYIGDYVKTCDFQTVSTIGGSGFTLSYTNNLMDKNIQLHIGNNNSSPSTSLYNAVYTTDPVTGTDGAHLPAVNANVVLTVTGVTITSAICNGVNGAIAGSNASWTGVNGSLNITFTTTG